MQVAQSVPGPMEARRAIYLERLAATCNVQASADAAEVDGQRRLCEPDARRRVSRESRCRAPSWARPAGRGLDRARDAKRGADADSGTDKTVEPSEKVRRRRSTGTRGWNCSRHYQRGPAGSAQRRPPMCRRVAIQQCTRRGQLRKLNALVLGTLQCSTEQSRRGPRCLRRRASHPAQSSADA